MMSKLVGALIAGLILGIIYSGEATAAAAAPPAYGGEDVYSHTPFQVGEVAEYKVYYLGVFVGFGKMLVMPSLRYQGQLVRVFTGVARTGKWYEAIYKADDFVSAYSRATDFAVEKFYLRQDEDKLFGSGTHLEKWFNFDHKAGKVSEVEVKKDQEISRETFDLQPGSTDTLSIFYRVRADTFGPTLGEEKKYLLYSSKKNWWLKVTVLGREELRVAAGTFATVKLGIESYVGQQLEQKGPITVWLAEKEPHRPLVKIEGTVKIGWVGLELSSFIGQPASSPPAPPAVQH